MSHSRRALFLGLFLVSGACGLMYEIVWSRLLVLVFGGTTYAITTVLACFMGGLALGSFLAGRISDRIRRPARAYGVLEIAIGAYCLFIPWMLEGAGPGYAWLAAQTGQSFGLLTSARVLVSAAILLAPTACMGATLPLLVKAFSGRDGTAGGHVAALYGVNSAGAFLGCVGAGFFLLPWLGLRGTIWLAAALNIGAGLAALAISRAEMAETAPRAEPRRPTRKPLRRREAGSPPPPAASSMPAPLLLVLYAFSGFAAMAYQVAWTRALILSLGSSTYAFSAIVAAYILGIAAGSLAIGRWVDRLRRPLFAAGALEGAIAISALIVAPMFAELPGFAGALSTAPGADYIGVLMAEAAAVLGLLIAPTLCMGALMPLVCRIYDAGARNVGRSVGTVYASNTAGTIAGALVAGFVFIPAAGIGAQNTILLASAISGAIASVFILSDVSLRRPAWIGAVAAGWIAGIAGGVVVRPWSKATMVSGPFLGRGAEWFEVLEYIEDADATIAVVDADGERSLVVNGKPDASSGIADLYTQYLLAHIPLSVRPDARRVCVIGLGSGSTAGAALAHPVERVDVAEISAGVIRAARRFDDVNGGALDDPRMRLHRADGRNFLLLADGTFDVIISEPSNVWMSGVANLYTREFFQLSKEKLSPGGLQCQWLHSYSISVEDFAAILNTLASVYRHVQLWEMSLGDFLAIGSDEPLTLDIERLYLAGRRKELRPLLERIMLCDPLQLANHYIGEGSELMGWIKTQKPLTDNRPRLEFSAPRHLLDAPDTFLPARRFLSALKGHPAFPVSGPESLHAAFRDAIDRARRCGAARSEFLADPRVSDVVADPYAAFAEIARDGARDYRTIFALSQLLEDLVRNTGRSDVADTLLALARDAAPGMPEIARLLQGDLEGRAWPLAWAPRRDARPEAQAAMAEARRLASEDAGAAPALARAEEALRLAPDDFEALGLAGKLAQDAGNPERALAWLLRAGLIDPEDGPVHYYLARACARLRRNERALEFLSIAIERGDADRAAVEAESDFAAIEGLDSLIPASPRIE